MSILPIVRPLHPHLEDFDADFSAALESGNVTNNGPWVRMFEDSLSQYLKIPTIVFNNGQSALMAMLAASDVRGGQVICPSFTFCATPHAIAWAGAKPQFVDIDERTLCMDPALYGARIDFDTKAILGVDPYGMMWQPSLHKGGNIKVLCDSAPSFGSRFLGKARPLDAQIFSFHATKPFSTMEGGALSSNDPDLLNRAKRIRNFGQDDGGDCESPGFNGKMLEVCAMIGLRQFDQWGDDSTARYDSAADLGEALQGIPGLRVVADPPHQAPIWLYRPILIDEKEFGMSRDAVVLALKKSGIHVRTYYRPAHLLSCYRRVGYSLPVTERIAKQVIALPVYNNMMPGEIERISSSLKSLQSIGSP